MIDKSEAINRVLSMPEMVGWPGDIKLPFPEGRSVNMPQEWIQWAVEDLVYLEDLTSTQVSVERDYVVELIKKGAPDIEPLPLVMRLPDGEMLIEDGNHRLTAKLMLGEKTAKVLLVDTEQLPDEAISSAMEKGKISMRLFKQLVEQLILQELTKLLV